MAIYVPKPHYRNMKWLQVWLAKDSTSTKSANLTSVSVAADEIMPRVASRGQDLAAEVEQHPPGQEKREVKVKVMRPMQDSIHVLLRTVPLPPTSSDAFVLRAYLPPQSSPLLTVKSREFHVSGGCCVLTEATR